MDNNVLRNAGVALMRSTSPGHFVEGLTLGQIGQALYDFAAMREKYPALRDAKEAFEDHLRRSEWIQKNEDKLFDGMWGYHRDDAVRIVVERLMSERDRLRAKLDLVHGAIRADDERLYAAWVRIHGAPDDCANIGCDAPEWMADEILRLRAELDAAHDGEDALRSEVAKLRAQIAALQSVPHGVELTEDDVRRALMSNAIDVDVEGVTPRLNRIIVSRLVPTTIKPLQPEERRMGPDEVVVPRSAAEYAILAFDWIECPDSEHYEASRAFLDALRTSAQDHGQRGEG